MFSAVWSIKVLVKSLQAASLSKASSNLSSLVISYSTVSNILGNLNGTTLTSLLKSFPLWMERSGFQSGPFLGQVSKNSTERPLT